MNRAQPRQSLIHADWRCRSFIPAFARAAAGMHGIALGGSRFVNDALEKTANSRVGQRTGIITLGVFEHLVFAVWLVQRDFCLLLEFADFERALRPFVQKLYEFLVNFIDAAPP